MVALGVTGGIVVAAALAVALYPLFWIPSGCSGGPTLDGPIGCTLSLEEGAAGCPPGANATNTSCDYRFLVTQSRGDLAASDLNFLIANPAGALLWAHYTITVVTLLGDGCGVAAYNFDNNSWGPTVSPSECHGWNASRAMVQFGDLLTLAPTSQGGLPLAQAGDHLLVIGVGDFSGQLDVPIR